MKSSEGTVDLVRRKNLRWNGVTLERQVDDKPVERSGAKAKEAEAVLNY